MCNQCIVEMDHHCPFIDNCVGLDNLRPFTLFLLYAVLGVGYVLMLSMSLVMTDWASFKEISLVWSKIYHALNPAGQSSWLTKVCFPQGPRIGC